MLKNSPWLVVFDLDDTLISEKEYQLSGIQAVESYLTDLYHRPMQGVLFSAHDRGIFDLWGYACEYLSLPLSVSEALLWVYRLHQPQLSLRPDISQLLQNLESRHISVVLLTDGRSTTQRLKLQSVGLDSFPCYISEDYQSVKPHLNRFHAISDRWSNHRYVYVADNPAKDFYGPDQLGWLTLGAAWFPDCVYPSHSNISSQFYTQPTAWLHSPSELLSWLN